MHGIDLKKIFFLLLIFLNSATLIFTVNNIDIFYYNMSLIMITPAVFSICCQISQSSQIQGSALAIFFVLISVFTTTYVCITGNPNEAYIFAAIVFLWVILISLMGLSIERPVENISANQNLFNKTSCLIIICSSIPLLFSFMPNISLQKIISNVFNMTTMALIAGTFINMVEIFLSKRIYSKDLKSVFFVLYSANMIMAIIVFASYMFDSNQTNMIYTVYLFGVFLLLSIIMVYSFFLKPKPAPELNSLALSRAVSIYLIANFMFYAVITYSRLLTGGVSSPAIYFFIESFGAEIIFLVQLYFFLNLAISNKIKWIIIACGWPILIKNILGWQNIIHLNNIFYVSSISALLTVYISCYLSCLLKNKHHSKPVTI